MGHMPGGDKLHGFLAMPGLVIEEHIGSKRLQERGFFQAAQEQRLVQANIPFTQGANHPLV